ncbi:MAG: biotin--[acetyl-CoA-carboxylase] ligase [Lentimonas sp.]
MSTDTEYRQIETTEDEYAILNALLSAGDSFVSGSLLGEQLGISRPAIHGKLEKLRQKGFEIEAIRNKGYRLVKEPDILFPGLVRYYGTQIGQSFELLYFPVIDSTNSEAERQLSYGRKGPFAIASSCQTKGRGRLGRDWHSASAENLYLSVVFEPNIPPQQLQHFTLWAGIHICRALQAFVPKASLKIKWPNDLLCDGRKFAGMLTEARMDADSLRSIIFGIGLNLNSNPAKYPIGIRGLATSLYAVNGEALPLNLATTMVIAAIHDAYNCAIGGDTSEDIAAAWPPLSALSGKYVTAIMNGKEIYGIASGIDESGALLLQTESGAMHSIRAGDVTIKK